MYTAGNVSPPFVIGQSTIPRSFGGKASIEFGFHYTFNKTAWMIPLLFRQCLYYLESDISRTTRRPSLLLLENAISHERIENLSPYRYLRLKFLPKRTASILLSLDEVLKSCMKRR